MLMSDACGQWLVKQAQWTWSVDGRRSDGRPPGHVPQRPDVRPDRPRSDGDRRCPRPRRPARTAPTSPRSTSPTPTATGSSTSPTTTRRPGPASSPSASGSTSRRGRARARASTHDALTVEEGEAGELTLTRTHARPAPRPGDRDAHDHARDGHLGLRLRAGHDLRRVRGLRGDEVGPGAGAGRRAARGRRDVRRGDHGHERRRVARRPAEGDRDHPRPVQPPEVVEPTGSGADGGSRPGRRRRRGRRSKRTGSRRWSARCGSCAAARRASPSPSRRR